MEFTVEVRLEFASPLKAYLLLDHEINGFTGFLEAVTSEQSSDVL